METRKTFYQSLILAKIPLILSLQDREELSPTYGSFDRTYWQWKFIDFAGARFQEALLALSYVYIYDFDNNIFFNNPNILSYIEAGILFYERIQNIDGSFDEAYPYERSFVATGFLLFYLTEAYLLIHTKLSIEVKERLLNSFKKSGQWLIKNDETHAFISNHRLGACAGLYNLSVILNEKIYETRSLDLWDSVSRNQSFEGWFNEYGGADPGYLTQGIYYAAVFYERTKCQDVLNSLIKALEYIRYFIHPDGTIGGEYGSRNTEFYFPGGFEILARYNTTSEAICRHLLSSIKDRNIPCVESVDVYNLCPILNSIVSGCLFFSPNRESKPLPYLNKPDFVRVFKDFHIYIRKSKNYYAIIGISKGGVIKVFDIENKRLIKSCVGIFGKIDNKIVTSQFFHKQGLKSDIEGDRITIEGSLVYANYSLLSPIKMIIFRLLSLLISFMSSGSKYLKKLIVYFLISKKKHTKWRFKRIITFNEACEISLLTETIGLPQGNFKEMKLHTSYHMGSSKYYKVSDLD